MSIKLGLQNELVEIGPDLRQIEQNGGEAR